MIYREGNVAQNALPSLFPGNSFARKIALCSVCMLLLSGNHLCVSQKQYHAKILYRHDQEAAAFVRNICCM